VAIGATVVLDGGEHVIARGVNGVALRAVGADGVERGIDVAGDAALDEALVQVARGERGAAGGERDDERTGERDPDLPASLHGLLLGSISHLPPR
jgi:hypothetical protein